jgi:hypothetical protein
MTKETISAVSRTSWKRLDAMRDKDIDLSEIPEITAAQMARAKLRVAGKPIQNGFPQIQVTRKDGSECFSMNNNPCDATLLDFWCWSTSDLVSNATRGVLAEYIVASALGLTNGVREQWKAFDLEYRGEKIEVKSAAYLQSWYHRELSKITFPIRPTRNWDASTNVQSKTARRRASIYVFCVLDHKDKATLDPLNLDQWRFYILDATVLNRKLGKQKSVGLTGLLKLKPRQARYDKIKICIEEISRRR